MESITLTIDGQKVKVAPKATVLEAATQVGIYIPTLCYHRDLKPFGACRLCLVEIEGMRGFPTACTTPAADGMVVQTNTPQLLHLRRSIFELTLSERPGSCLIGHQMKQSGSPDVCRHNLVDIERCGICANDNRCDLQRVVNYLQVKQVALPSSFETIPVESSDPFFERDYNQCILCGRCVRVCDEIRGRGAVAFTYRGSQSTIGTAFGRPLKESGCQFCGACVDMCPTAALMEKTARGAGPTDREVTTTCPYCGVGCQLNLEIKGRTIIRVTPDVNGPANKGQACVKGKFGLDFVGHPDRLTSPLIKKDGEFVEATWDEALALIATRLEGYTGDQFAAISSAKCTNEDNYIFQKFTRGVMGTNNIDHCARL